jgi:hypothetical protein
MNETAAPELVSLIDSILDVSVRYVKGGVGETAESGVLRGMLRHCNCSQPRCTQ